jgi:outer membrane protein OmpA-like peptidoglycan-associated protein
MKTTHLSFTLIVALAAGCASTPADRAPPRRADEDDSAMDTAANAQAGTPARTGPLALTIIGVYPEPTLAATCGLTLPPAAYFEFDSAALDAPDNNTLRELATCLTTGPLAGRKVELVGHADAAGTDDYDEQLGRSRAESVQDFLRRQGVTEDMLVTRSEGEQMAPQAAPTEWPYYRRVEIRLLPE